MNTQERIKEAEKAFENHVPTLSTYGKAVVLDWKNINGSYDYAVRYVMLDDVLYISGDLGSAVVQLKEKATLKNISSYHLDYFVKRIECSTDLYDFDPKDAENEIREYMYEVLENDDGLDDNETYAIEMLIYQLVENAKITNEIWFDDNASKQLIKINNMFSGFVFDEYDFEDFGKSISMFVILWLTGIKMAYQALQKNSENDRT